MKTILSRSLVTALLSCIAVPGFAAVCSPDYGDPVQTLATPSRYADDDTSRSRIDEEAEADALEELAPVDNFIEALVADANLVVKLSSNAAADQDQSSAEAEDALNCALDGLALWADADALSNFETVTAKITLGSRLAGIALAMRQLAPFAETDPRWESATHWLHARLSSDMDFWLSADAPPRASINNLRAWSALALVAGSSTIDDSYIAGYGAALVERLICSVDEDGAFPAEMTRRNLALHYHLHALSALVPAAALIGEEGGPFPAGAQVGEVCGSALRRAVDFALDDLSSGGELTRQKAGAEQSYFNGGDELRPHHMAWLAAYVALYDDDERAAAILEGLPWVSNSKLGGDQTLQW